MMSAAYRSAGGVGPDLVLIHGFASDRLSWAANVSPLTSVARVHVLDLPGHGDAGADVGDGSIATLAASVKSALHAHGISKAHLLGHSLGGAVALHIAAHDPQMVSSLALIAPAGLGGGIDFGFVKGLASSTELDPTLELLRKLVVKPQMINKLLAKRLLDHLVKDGMRAGLTKIAAQLHQSETQEIPHLLHSISPHLPRLVMWGTKDLINPLDTQRIAAWHAHPLIIDEAGHLPHIERPEVANAALVTFLRGQP